MRRRFRAIVSHISDRSKQHEIERNDGSTELVTTQRGCEITLDSWGEVPGWDSLVSDLLGKKVTVTIED